MKPILYSADGEVAPIKRVRGRTKALAEFEAALPEATEDSPDLHVGVGTRTRPRTPRISSSASERPGRARPSTSN